MNGPSPRCDFRGSSSLVYCDVSVSPTIDRQNTAKLTAQLSTETNGLLLIEVQVTSCEPSIALEDDKGELVERVTRRVSLANRKTKLGRRVIHRETISCEAHRRPNVETPQANYGRINIELGVSKEDGHVQEDRPSGDVYTRIDS